MLGENKENRRRLVEGDEVNFNGGRVMLVVGWVCWRLGGFRGWSEVAGLFLNDIIWGIHVIIPLFFLCVI